MNVVSFVDQDMVMRYFGGGNGHLKNASPLQAPGFDLGPNDPSSKEMAVEDDDDDPCSSTNDDLGTVQQPSRDVIINGGELVQLEVTEDDEVDKDKEEYEDDSDSNEGGNQTDEDVDEEGEDDYGYVWI